ncbi:MAG: replication initiation protein [Candidatus Thiodiazotropha endolucinida]
MMKENQGDGAGRSSKVCKANIMIEAHYKLNLVEHRIILGCIAKLDSRKPIPGKIHFTAREYANSFNTSLNQAYGALVSGTKILHKRTLAVRTVQGERRRIRWLQGEVAHHSGEAEIVLRFSEVVKTYLTLLNRCFTEYELEKVADLSSTYSIRLYEQLVQWRSTGTMIVTLDDFKGRMGLENQYSNFRGLKQFVINRAVEELCGKSGMSIQWEVKRKGVKAVGLVFNFKEKSLKSSKLLRFTDYQGDH